MPGLRLPLPIAAERIAPIPAAFIISSPLNPASLPAVTNCEAISLVAKPTFCIARDENTAALLSLSIPTPPAIPIAAISAAVSRAARAVTSRLVCVRASAASSLVVSPLISA